MNTPRRVASFASLTHRTTRRKIVKKYEEYRRADKNASFFAGRWFKHCRDKQIPYITVETARRYAKVRWDHISFDRVVDERFRQAGTRLRDAAIQIGTRYSRAPMRYEASGLLVTFEGLEIVEARLVAGELYDLVMSVVSGQPS